MTYNQLSNPKSNVRRRRVLIVSKITLTNQMSSTKAQLEAVWDRSDQLAKLCDAAQGKLALLTSRYEMLVERSIDLSKLRPYDPRWNDENGMPVPQEVTLVAFGQVEAARAELEAVIRERREVIEEGERLLVIFIHEPIGRSSGG